MQLTAEKKIAGILAPLFGLRSDNDLGIGDVEVLREFIDWAAEIGFKLVQMLPINEMGHDNSPYNAISAMAIELTTLHLAPGSPEELTRADYERLLGQADLAKLRHGSVKYELVKKLKRGLLERAFANFSGSATRIRQGKFQQFCEREGSWLNDYAFFRTLVEENGDNEAWDKWPLEQRQNSSAHRWLEKQPTKKQTQFRDREKFFR